MKKYNLQTEFKKLLADTVTPVSIYLKLRDRFANAILLESSDYHGHENSYSYICCEPIAGFSVNGDEVKLEYPYKEIEHKRLDNKRTAVEELSRFAASFEAHDPGFKFISSGLFGYMTYDAVTYFEDIEFDEGKEDQFDIPEILYHVYRYIIVIDHFKNELYIIEHQLAGEESTGGGIEKIQSLIYNKNFPTYSFNSNDQEVSNFSDEEFLSVISKGRDHCYKGDVFQIVLSRRFSRGFKGDEFNVYRALRSVNPSPYLFYFDYGNFKIFGSSPEAQITVKDNKASIYPIAGTYRRTGNDEEDAVEAKKLYKDEKENAEHVMLVDLARNDLSRNGNQVKVEVFKELQYYSHVIHLVSKVTGSVAEGMSSVQIAADTFPAGTLSGAPKYSAMQLIDRYENIRRGYYGGAIGYIGFNGDFNHAIMIRSFLSRKNTLFFQAGAGVVAKSVVENELQEVNNKVEALRLAIALAENI